MEAEESKPMMTEIDEPKLEERILLESEGMAASFCNAGCLSNPQTTAFAALKARQFVLFMEAITDERFDINGTYTDPEDDLEKNLLTVAIDQWKNPSDDKYILELMVCGAKLDKVNEETEVAPIHKVIKLANRGLVEKMVNHWTFKDCDVNVQDGDGLTPLHKAVELLSETDESQHSEVLAITDLLLRTDRVEVNAQDLRGGQTPLFYAAYAGNKKAVELLLNHGANPDAEIEDGQKIREVIEANIEGFNFLAFVDKVKAMPIKQRLFDAVETNDLNGLKRLAFFKTHGSGADLDWNCNNGSMTPLQLACSKGNFKVVEYLLKREGIEANLTTAAERRTPALIAAHHGFFDCLKILKSNPGVDFSAVEPISGKTILHELFKRDSAMFHFQNKAKNASYEKCLEILLDGEGSRKFEGQISRILNYQEKLEGNTALHFATMQADQEIIKILLKRGANMGVKNFRDKTPVESILPETLQEFLDDCIQEEGVVTDENFKITFRYDFLAPPILDEAMASNRALIVDADDLGDNEEDNEKRALPETEALWYLSTASKKHRSLLKHPVLASFLWLKWQRIRTLFYANLVLYFLFVVAVTAFIFLKFGGKSAISSAFVTVEENCTSTAEGFCYNGTDPAWLYGLSALITVLLVVLITREIFQMLVSIKRYCCSPENLMEVTIIVLVFVIVFDRDPKSMDFNRHLAAVVVLLTWTEFLVLIGRHPRLSTNITMFSTVITTFFGFLLWYGIIIIAFGISFYIMFHRDHRGATLNAEYPFFDTVGLALFKTSTMFVGELEFADLPFTDNAISNLIFLAFIFLIVVVLMNLLNGLAVSDTGLIRDEAEVVGWSSRVELITYTESMLLGDPFYFLSNWPPVKLLKRLPSCAVCRALYRFPRVRDVLQKISGGTQILLFYTCLPKKKATFYPNKKSSSIIGGVLNYKRSLKVDDEVAADIDGEVRRPHRYTEQSQRHQAQKLAISNEVLDSAKEVILERQRSTKEEDQRVGLMKAMENKLESKLLIIEELLLRLTKNV